MATVKEYGLRIQVQDMAFKFGEFSVNERVFLKDDILYARLGRVTAVPVDKVDFQSTKIWVPVCFAGTLNGRYELILASNLKRG